MGVIGRVVLHAVACGALVILALSPIDLVYQRFQHAKDLKMSKKEVRDEAKNSEGDPQVKARIRQVQREMAMNRMMADVPEADAVVMNPTHFAVALQHATATARTPRRASSPRAWTTSPCASAISPVSSEVAVIEDPPLARALHRACEIGEHVPEELFEAVATPRLRLPHGGPRHRRGDRLMAGPNGLAAARQDRLKRVTDWLLGFGVLGLLLTLVAPLPPIVLDLLLAVNLSAAVMLLMLTMHARSSTEISTFPTILLFATLFRLGLNVASTRLILTGGEAGNVIQAFGAT